MTAQTKFKLCVIAGGLVLLTFAFLLLDSKKEAPIEANVLQGDVTPGKNAGKTSGRTGREFPLQTKVAREDLRSLSPAERERFDAAMGEFEIHLRSLEFRNSKLKFHQDLTARSVWHYELLPPRKEDLKEIEIKIDELISDNSLTLKERKLFSRYAARASSEMLIVPGKTGSLFFSIPVDSSQSIIVDRSSDHPHVEKLTLELKASGGRNAESLGFGPGELMMVKKTEFGWRYERFLMVNEK